MKCDKCGKERSYLKRQNPTGVKGIFWCVVCLGEEPEPTKGEDMSAEKQLEHWVKGWSVHNKRTDECCPDFSCCRPELKWPRAQRVKFAEAFINEDFETTRALLADAFYELIEQEYPDADVYLAEGDE
jgi:hypothetical protein